MRYDRVNPMKKIRIIQAVFLLFLIDAAFLSPAFAFWMWTPETNRWVNPKFSVKDTPKQQLEYAKEFYSSKDYNKAMNEFEKLIKHYPRSKEAPEAQFYIALCFEGQGKVFEAFKAYQKIVEKYPFSERFTDVVEKQYQIGEKLLEGGEKRSGFVNAVIGGDYDVVEVFRKVIKNAPYGKYAAPSQYKIGLYLLEKELYQEARDEFEKVVNDYPQSEWVKAAQYQIALADSKRSSKAPYEQKVTQVAVDEFKDFLKQNPDAQLSQKAQDQVHHLRDKDAQNNFLIAEFYVKQKKYQAAKIYYQAVIDDFHDTSWAPKAADKLKELNKKGL